MASAIRIPDMGTTADTLTLQSWLIEEGASVERGDALAEIETDKAVTELESFAEGVLLKQVVPAGAQVQAGDTVAWIGQAGESIPE